jgi:hypothetical protein
MVHDVEKTDHIKRSARRLCENRCRYNPASAVEKEVIDDITQRDCVKQLVLEVISSLHGEDGNIRIGAAEILGVITPASMASIVLEELQTHLDDNFVRDYTYGGFQGDESDMRTVAECCKESIEKLNKVLIEG